MAFEVTINRDEDIKALDLTQVAKALNERTDILNKIREEAGSAYDATKVTSIDVKDGADFAMQWQARNAELNKLVDRRDELMKFEEGARNADAARKWANGHDVDPGRFAPGGERNALVAQPKSFGQIFVESPSYERVRDAVKNRVPNVGAMLDIDPRNLFGRGPQNATFLTSAGWAPESLRTGRVVLDEQRGIEVTDALPIFPTSMAVISYMEETTFTNAAAERAEEGAYAESALALTERNVTVRSIGTSLPVTDEQMADVDGIGPYLDQRLGFMVRQKLDSQIIVGSGVAPALLGTLNVAGINSQAQGADDTESAIYKGMDQVIVTGRAQPNVVIVHPTDWQVVRLHKTADGVYIWGSPAEAGPDRIWGLPVIKTTAVTLHTAIVGDYARFSGLHMKQGLEVLTGFVNDDFKNGRVTIRAGIRAAVVHYRPSAFSQVTGLHA